MERLTCSWQLKEELHPGDLLRFLQDLAGEDADRRGGGREDLLKVDCVWVLVKNRLSISRWPQAGETVTVTTWPLSGRRGLYPRGFEVRDQQGELLITVDSLWAIIDIHSRSMLLGESRGVALEGVEEGRLSPPQKLRIPEGGERYPLSPRPEQIDVNGHMNNAAYLDAAEELLPASFAGRQLREIAVDYEHELLPGRSASVRVVPEENDCFFEGSMEDRLCFRLRLSFA